jgi:hypothetical protein
MLLVQLIRTLLRWLPWLLALVLIYFIVKEAGKWFGNKEEEPVEVVNHQTILQEVENLGRLELVRYNFKELIELNEKNKPYLGVFDVPDSRVVVISQGEAVGCIDLTKMGEQDIRLQGDTVLVRLPEPELCYYKLDMENTRIYSIEKQVYFKEESELAQKALRLAERQMRDAALKSGILEQTRQNAETMLRPLLEKVGGRHIIFLDQLPEEVPIDRG